MYRAMVPREHSRLNGSPLGPQFTTSSISLPIYILMYQLGPRQHDTRSSFDPLTSKPTIDDPADEHQEMESARYLAEKVRVKEVSSKLCKGVPEKRHRQQLLGDSYEYLILG